MKIGDTIENYLIEAEIGDQKGGYGDLYRATHNISKENVALKVSKSPDNKDRFIAENSILQKLQPHRHIIAPLSEARTSAPDHHYYFMELADYDLAKLITNNPYSTFSTKMSIFREVCIGLQHAHSRDITHRDLHHGNVLFINNTSKLTDFGLSKDFSSGVNLTKGKPAWGWMVTPPEIRFDIWTTPKLEDHIVGDMYALGMLLYTLFMTPPINEAFLLQTQVQSYLEKYPDSGKDTPEQRFSIYREWLGTSWAKGHSHLNVELIDDTENEILNELLVTLTHLDFDNRFNSVTVLLERLGQLGV